LRNIKLLHSIKSTESFYKSVAKVRLFDMRGLAAEAASPQPAAACVRRWLFVVLAAILPDHHPPPEAA
jgi:hypothetical protein